MAGSACDSVAPHIIAPFIESYCVRALRICCQRAARTTDDKHSTVKYKSFRSTFETKDKLFVVSRSAKSVRTTDSDAKNYAVC